MWLSLWSPGCRDGRSVVLTHRLTRTPLRTLCEPVLLLVQVTLEKSVLVQVTFAGEKCSGVGRVGEECVGAGHVKVVLFWSVMVQVTLVWSAGRVGAE